MHTGTHTHRNTHIQKHTHTQKHTHIQEHTHTQEHTHIWTGQGGHHRGPQGAGSGALTVCQCCTTCTAARTRGCSCTPSSGSATRWGKGAVQGTGVHTYKGAHLQRVEPVWTQPSEFCSSILGLAWPSRVGTATEHRSLCSRWLLAPACPSPSHQGDSCQHALGRGDLRPAQLQLCPKTLCTQTAQGQVHTRTVPQNQDR